MLGRVLLVAVFVALASVARAEVPIVNINCVDRTWNRVFEREVARYGLAKRADAFLSAVYRMQKLPAPYEISVVIVDCPMGRQSVRVAQLMSMPSFGNGSFGFVRYFAIYVSLGFIRNTEMDELVREARKMVCIIQAGVATGRDVRMTDAYAPVALECLLREALAVGESEEIRWLRRVLGNPIVASGIR